MYRITGIMLYPVNEKIEGELTPEKMYHIDVLDSDGPKVFCSGYIMALVQNNIAQYYQFSVDLMYEGGEELPYDKLIADSKIRSIINAICGIIFNNYIGK